MGNTLLEIINDLLQIFQRHAMSDDLDVVHIKRGFHVRSSAAIITAFEISGGIVEAFVEKPALNGGMKVFELLQKGTTRL